MRITLLSIIFVILVFNIFAQENAVKLNKIENYILKSMQTFEVPGAAVAIVKNSEVIMAKGFGKKTIGGDTPVNETTLFGIASNTKAFTATALAILVEEGKLEWDKPVINYLPWFRLSDPFVTAELTIRDLLVHRSGLGLGAGDLLWWPATTYTRKEVVEHLRYIPLATSFRSTYAYDNVLYTVAGEVIREVSGMVWEDFVSQNILEPVGMSTSNIRHPGFDKLPNVATTHARVEGTLQKVKPFTSDNTNPAGGIISNATDMAKWMIVQLDSGKLADGTLLFTPQSTKELWSLVTPMPILETFPELKPAKPKFKGYALGFGVQDYRGYKLIRHTGGLPGYVSIVVMIPELKLGITVLTNQESSAAFYSIAYYILDKFINIPEYDWISAYQNVMKKRASLIDKKKKLAEKQRDEKSKPSLPFNKYVGKYVDQWYGPMEIFLEKDKLILQFIPTPEMRGVLEHWQYDTFVVRWFDRSLRADAYIYFALKPDGTIDNVKMYPFSPEVDFSFDFQDLLFKPVRHKQTNLN